MMAEFARRALPALAALVLLASAPSAAVASVELTDGSFESPGETSPGMPGAPGYWGGDLCEVVFAEGGVSPHDGARMLRFAGTTPDGPASGSVTCSLCQMIDMRAHSQSIRSGQSRLVAAVYFNRVPGDGLTDTAFSLTVDAFFGDPAGYPDPVSVTRTDSITVELGSDGERSTWEMVTAELELPVDTEYVCIILSATEDVFDDGAGVEFDGHYADNAIVDLFVPVGSDDASWSRIKLLR